MEWSAARSRQRTAMPRRSPGRIPRARSRSGFQRSNEGSSRMSNDQDKSSITSRSESAPARSELDSFLADIRGRTTAAASTRGRLIFALDATMSREWAWDTACTLQAEMFREVATVGGLDMQLVYYRGSLGECKASRWFSQSEPLTKAMSQIRCE